MYDIVGKRNWFFAISAILTIPGLFFIILGGLKPSIDFTGGTEWEVRYAEEPSAAEMTAALADLGYEDVVVTELPGGYLRIRTEPIDLLPAVAPVPSPSGSVAPSGSREPIGRCGGIRQRLAECVSVARGEPVDLGIPVDRTHAGARKRPRCRSPRARSSPTSRRSSWISSDPGNHGSCGRSAR